MKSLTNHIIPVLIILLINQNTFSQNIVHISGKVINAKSNSINISYPANNLTSTAIKKKVILDGSGNFNLNYENVSIGQYLVWHEIAPFNILMVNLYLSPGDTCYIDFDCSNSSVDIYSNNNQSGLKLLNKLGDLQKKLSINSENEFSKYDIIEINDTIQKCLDIQLNLIKNLYEKGEINFDFYTIASNDIVYFYGALYYDLVSHLVFISEGSLPKDHPRYFHQSFQSLRFADSTLVELFSIFDNNPSDHLEKGNQVKLQDDLKDLGVKYSSNYLGLLSKYMHYKSYYLPLRDGVFESQKMNENFHHYNLYKYFENLEGDGFEYGVGEYFYRWFHKINMADKLVEPYLGFKKHYPNNPYIPYIDPLLKGFEDYLQIDTSEFSQNIEFLSNTESINSFNDLLDIFSGKILFIDIWALTCPPCTKEFEYYKDLYKFLSLYSIDVLFISFDKQENKEHWKRIVKKYDLTGYHIIASQKLQEDIKEKTKMIGVPWYLIKNKGDELSNEFINRPSSKDKLYDQIINYIDK